MGREGRMKRLAVFAGLLLASCTTQQEAAQPAMASAAPQSSGRCAALVGRDFGPGIAVTTRRSVGTVASVSGRTSVIVPILAARRWTRDVRNRA